MNLFLTLSSLWLAITFFHYQNLKGKQHRCLDEVIRRLDIINDITIKACNTTPYSRSQGEYDFNSKILMKSIDQFKSSAPILCCNSKDHEILRQQCVELLEYIEINTPVESPENITLNSNGNMENKLETTLMVHQLANKVVTSIYSLL